jgi:hypothetical protein
VMPGTARNERTSGGQLEVWQARWQLAVSRDFHRLLSYT